MIDIALGGENASEVVDERNIVVVVAVELRRCGVEGFPIGMDHSDVRGVPNLTQGAGGDIMPMPKKKRRKLREDVPSCIDRSIREVASVDRITNRCRAGVFTVVPYDTGEP